MSTSRIRGSFVVGSILSIGSVVMLLCDVASNFPDESTQAFVSGLLVAGAILPVVAMLVIAWQMTLSRDSSQSQMDFMYKMTHELQTPVSTISLASDMLNNPAVLSTPERLKKYVRMIREESNRMQWHIENVLHIAKAESEVLLLKLEKTPINDLILSILERYEGQVNANLNAPETLIALDKQHFINVLRNLIENALKYTPENPLILVSTYSRRDMLVVSVKDNGIGIAKNEQKKIFTNFYRIQDNSSNIKGFGLGLSYVQQIAKAHHWQLELVSNKGEGSDFRILIPIPSS
jgi:two-component system, OmpR family, phosphate regulon sensor histidine kinase PhoR